MRELRIPTRKTNPIHNDVPENTRFLLLDQPSGEANTMGTLINKIDEVAINEKTANWKARVMLLILQATNNYTIWSLYQPKIILKYIIRGFYHESIDSIWFMILLPLYSYMKSGENSFFTNEHAELSIYPYIGIDRLNNTREIFLQIVVVSTHMAMF